jgi:lambda repressor-like predicted transcriptional regulator
MSTTARAWCDCGFHGDYRSHAVAAYALRRHSCARWRAKAAAARRRSDRARTVDRTPQPCRHPRARHEHGTHACYALDRCRCPSCAAANRSYEARRTRDRAYGHTDLVGATIVRQHIAALAATGIGLKTLAARSGVSHGALWKIVYGVPSTGRPPSRRVHRATANKILAVPAEPLRVAADHARIRATGTARRLRALIANGWSVAKLAQLAGVNRQALDPLLDDAGDFWRLVHARHARAVAALYDRLWNTPSPADQWRDKIAASRARRRAHTAGWPPPAAWDEEDIDDPNAWPDPGWRDEPTAVAA